MRSLRWWPLGLVTLSWLVGCSVSPSSPGDGTGSGGGGAGSAPYTASPKPAATPTPSDRYTLNFDDWQPGPLRSDAPFVDVYDELQAEGIAPPSWLFKGNWEVADVSTPQLTSRVLRQTKVQQRPPITLLRFRGNFYGQPNGLMPDHYRMEVTQQPIRSPYNLPPTGDQGVQCYYLDMNHYAEVVTTPSQIQLWTCNGGQPDSSEGWDKVWSQDLGTKPGDTRRVGAIVDVKRRHFTVLYNGQPIADAALDLIDPTKPHYVSLRAIGNEVNFDDFELQRLP